MAQQPQQQSQADERHDVRRTTYLLLSDVHEQELARKHLKDAGVPKNAKIVDELRLQRMSEDDVVIVVYRDPPEESPGFELTQDMRRIAKPSPEKIKMSERIRVSEAGFDDSGDVDERALVRLIAAACAPNVCVKYRSEKDMHTLRLAYA